MNVLKLTDKELGLLVHLIRREARLIGYDTIYHEYNKKIWPSRLKGMQTIVRKLNAARD